MQTSNRDIAEKFIKLADLLELEDENPFRIRAYRNAARIIRSYPKNFHEMVEAGEDLTQIHNIGDTLAKKITEIVQTGKISLLRRLEKEIPHDLEIMLKIPGLGPKRVRTLHEILHINTLNDLEMALKKGKVESVKGFGPKLIQTITEGLKQKRYETHRHRLYDVLPVAQALAEELRKIERVDRLEIAGSIRRRRDTVKDIDMVAACFSGSPLMERFVSHQDVKSIVMEGPTRSSVILKNGLQVDLRVVPPYDFGAALHHFTGSRAHNIALRKMALKKGIKINEYGIFRSDKRIGGEKESDVYDILKMQYIEPELRENRGEIALALKHSLPRLIERGDIRGDLHIHTTRSDGNASLEEMAEAARALGYEYIAVTDHTKHLTIAHGQDEERVLQELEMIDHINATLKGFTILKSAEVDILADGTLDLPQSVLEKLDLVVGAVHYKFNLTKKEQTRRIIKAMENPCFNILAHPSGRLIGLREPYEVDMDAIINVAKELGCILELNAQPDRLDLDDSYCKAAKEAGVKIALSSDAHSVNDLHYISYGISQARRGWLEKEDVVNTHPLTQFRKLLRR